MAPPADIPPSLRGLVDQAIADLSTRLGIGSAGIVAMSAKAVEWPDRSMGCPKPGMGYLQVPIDGAVIELGVGSATYRYHSGGSVAPFLCTKA